MNSVYDVNADGWEKIVLKSEILVVVDFWHEQCLWCKKLDPIYGLIADRYKNKVKFVKLNVLENPEHRQIAIKYGIMSTPTLVFFCRGKPIGRFTGFKPKDELEKLVKEFVDKNLECIETSSELKSHTDKLAKKPPKRPK